MHKKITELRFLLLLILFTTVIIFCSIFFSSFASAREWFVNNQASNCDNTGAGTLAVPLCNISAANSRHSGGDTVYIMPGEYRESYSCYGIESMLCPQSGPSPNNKTIYSGYGDKSQVKLIASQPVTGWSVYSGNVSQASFTAPTRCGGIQSTSCFEDRQRWYIPAGSISAVDRPGRYYFDGTTIYLYPFSGTPSSHLIECSKIKGIGEWMDPSPAKRMSNFVLMNFTIMHTHDRAVNMGDNNHNITIYNNEFAFDSGCRTGFGNPSAIMHDAYGTPGYYDPYAQNINISNNIIHDLGNDLGSALDIAQGRAPLATSISNHDGDGICAYSYYNSVIENNIIYNVGMGVDLKLGDANVTIKNNTIYNTTYAGIRFGCRDFNNTIVENKIYNSLFGNSIYIGMGSINSIIVNNVIWNTIQTDRRSLDLERGDCSFEHGNINTVIFKNNIVMGRGQEIQLQYGAETGSSFNNNYYDNTINNPTFNWYGTLYDLAGWRSVSSGFDTLSISGNPLFVNTGNFDFHLQSTSPAIDNGVIIPNIHCQYVGIDVRNAPGCRVWYGTAPDIGAFEYPSSAGSSGICEATGSGRCYYVSTSGNNANNGNFTNPFQTVQRGVNALGTPGDVLYIRGGTYQEIVTRTGMGLSGDSQNRITIKGYPGETVTIDGNHAGITLYLNAHYLTIENLTIINGDHMSLEFFDQSSHLLIRNLDIYGTNGGCTGEQSQIYLEMVTDSIIENNKVHDSSFGGTAGTNCGGIGTDSSDFSTGTRNITIRNNLIYNMPGSGSGIWQKHPGVGGLEIYNNTIYNTVTGVLNRNRNSHIHHNLIYNMTGDALIFWGQIQPNNENINVEYNTFSTCSLSSVAYEFGINISLKNNIYYECSANSGSSMTYGFFHCSLCRTEWPMDHQSISFVNSDNNCIYYIPTSLAFLHYVSTGYSLQAARGNFSYDVNSVFNNPNFISTTPGNPNFLRPAAGNACENLGYYANGTAPQNQTICTEPYNNYRCDCINITELGNTINGWNTGQININQLITNIKIWKNCSS